MNISSNTWAWLKGMSKDSIGSVKWRIVPMIWNKTICIRYLPSLSLARESKIEHDYFEPTSLEKGNLDICFFLWGLGEVQGWHATPEFKGFLKSCFHFSLWQVWGIVNNPSKWEGVWRVHYCLQQQSISRLNCSSLEFVHMWCATTEEGATRGAGLRVEDRRRFWTSYYMSLNSVSLFIKWG